MGQLEWVRSHVERCMQGVWADACLDTDGDGDYRFRSQTGMGWIRVSDGDPIVVALNVIAAEGLKPSLALLKELNDINCRTRTAHACLSAGHLIIEQPMTADAVNQRTFSQAVDAVCEIADDIGPTIASVFGGSTPFSPEPADVN